MTTTAPDTRGEWDRLAAWWFSLNPVVRLTARWALILTLTAVAFRNSLVNLWQTTLAGGLIGYMWMVPVAAALAAVGTNFRRRTELPIHDRQTDVIVGVIGLGLALMVQGVLLKRYSEFFHLVRLDIFAMWVFALSSALVLFGIRPVARFGWVWALMGASSALPYQVVVILLGGGKFAAGIGTLLIAAAASAIAVGRTRRRAAIGAAVSFLIGLVILVGMEFLAPDLPILAFQMIPSLTSIVVVGVAALVFRRRNPTKELFSRKVEPLAAKQIWSAIPVVVAVAVALAFMPLPTQTSTTVISRTVPFDLVPGRPMAAPPGWTMTEEHTVTDVSRYYGDDAQLVRQKLTADVGDPRFDKLSAPRTVVVDSIVSDLPFSFDAYPGQVLYDTTAARLSSQLSIDLGYGVTGKLVSAVDDRLLVTWDVLRFAWGDQDEEQVVDIFAVDNHLPDAPFPIPQRGLVSTLRNLLTVLFRGNAVLVQSRPSFKDEELLTEFGRAFVAAQFGNAKAAQ
ncbi:hypothetical protein ABFW11_17340 [Mycolicibacterium porcinum]|uniref:MFS transporter n=1 Tax=Mycolicibacterium porcinum TaxID=39693 RepID=A0AAW5T0E1_9MYCO|nr:hypothetical protein [Mycobacterium sp. 20091114027_K0903767]MCV7388910.1 hypothetical protein [Mycolicibacterium porcinum]ORB45017.1 hypothetical protein BST41_00710 [Mycolicibacterium porcinum]CDO28176.1 hypothetical protein BN979_00954 [Mycolicibacterium vulneris]